MKVAIGPIEGHYGGAAQHILNIIKCSKNDFDKIEIPIILKEWGKIFRKFILPIQRKIPHRIEHSDKRFDMYGLQRFFDVPGFVKSRIGLRDYDVVHLHGHPYWHQVYQVSNPNTIFTVHNLYREGDFPYSWKYTIGRLTEEMVKTCKRSKKVVSVARWLQNDLFERFGIKSEYIPNGVNLEEFANRDGNRFRRNFGIEDDFYLFVARATKYKRPDLFARLAERVPGKKFVMIGRGLTKEEFREYLGRKLPFNLICLGEPKRQDVVDAFDACRSFVLTSANETFGIVLLEGMICGKPCVGANNLGPKEILNDRKTGFLFEPDNLESLVEKANLAWDAYDVGLAGQEEVKIKYDWRNIAPRIDELYGDL